MSTYRGLLSGMQEGEVVDRDFAAGMSNEGMGDLAIDCMQLIDRIYNELLSAFDQEKLREVMIAHNTIENPGAELLQKVMQSRSPDRDKKGLLAFKYVWETSFLLLFDRGALSDCFSSDLDIENLPDAVQHQLDRMSASVAEYKQELENSSRTVAAPKLSSADVHSFRSFVQGDAMGAAPASMIAIQKKIKTDPKFAEFAAKELKITKPLLGFVNKYLATPSVRLKAIDGKVKIGTEQTGFFETTKTDFDSWLQDAVNARLI